MMESLLFFLPSSIRSVIIGKGDESRLYIVWVSLLMGTVLSVWMHGYFVGLTRRSAESFRSFRCYFSPGSLR